MGKIWIIAKREYAATVKTKIFVISILLAPALIFGFMGLQAFLELSAQDEERRIAVCDGTNLLFDALAKRAKEQGKTVGLTESITQGLGSNYVIEPCNTDAMTEEVRLAYSDRILQGQLDAFVEIEAAVLDVPKGGQEGKVIYFSENTAFGKELQWFHATVDEVVRSHRIEKLGLDPEKVEAAVRPVQFEALKPYVKTSVGEVKRSDAALSMIAPVFSFAVVIMIFFSVMVQTGPLLQSVIEEKQQHIIEVLLGSVQPFELMAGKLLGQTAIALTLLGIYLFGGVVLAVYFVYTDLFSPSILIWFFVFELLALLMYGAVFISLGAACNELKDTQSLITPVMIIIVIPMMLTSQVISDPHSGLSVGLSFFPLTAPLLMVARLTATAAIPFWQPLLSAAMAAITAVLFVIGAGRVFRIGVLAQGKTPGLGKILRWAAGRQ